VQENELLPRWETGYIPVRSGENQRELFRNSSINWGKRRSEGGLRKGCTELENQNDLKWIRTGVWVFSVVRRVWPIHIRVRVPTVGKIVANIREWRVLKEKGVFWLVE